MTENAGPDMQPGFSLMEVVVSIVLLGVILVALAGLTFQTAQRTVQLADASARQGVLLQEVNRISAIPYSMITAQAGCDSLFADNHRFQRCVSVAQIGQTRRVTIVLNSGRLQRPDSVVFTRVQAPVSNLLNMQ
jgi:prepilin-type N-terminal cleavage/methylation domain-containing protein